MPGQGWLPASSDRKDAVKEQLDRLLLDPSFQRSKRYPSLLRFLVFRTLDGEADSLKERILGIEVFGRRPDDDTNEDPIVRVTVAEVRKRIQKYYEDPRHKNELHIVLPTGSYVPVFPEVAAFGNFGFTRLDDRIAGGLFAQLKEQS